jgi:hypothetical protein
MKFTTEGPIRIGMKDIGRAWRNRAKDARHVIRDSERPGLLLITNAQSQTWAREYKPRGVDPATGRRFATRKIPIGSPATFSPAEARAESDRIKDAVSAGNDPAVDRKVTIAQAARVRSATVERAVGLSRRPADEGEESRRTHFTGVVE